MATSRTPPVMDTDFSDNISLPKDNLLAKQIEAANDYIAEKDWVEATRILQKLVDRREDVFILDVRNAEEYQLCRIPGSVLVPLPELARRYRELPPDREHSRRAWPSDELVG